MAIGWNLAKFSTNENHSMRMVAHGQSLVLGRRAQTPFSWILAFAAGAYLQVISDKLQDTKKLQGTSYKLQITSYKLLQVTNHKQTHKYGHK